MARPPNKREQQIIAHALQLFSEGGYRDTSLEELAQRLGLTRQAFYYYFKSKDELLWRLIGRLGDQLRDQVEPIVASADGPEVKLERLVTAHVRALASNNEAWRIYFAERNLVSKGRDRRLKQGEDAYLNLIVDVISEGQRQGAFRRGNPRVLALLVDGFANSILRWYKPNGEIGVEQISGLVATVAVGAIRA